MKLMRPTNTYTHSAKCGFVHSRSDEKIRKQATSILGKIGLNVSDAIRLFLNQVVTREGMPFPVRIPNVETIVAMESVDRGEDLEMVMLEQLKEKFQVERKNYKSTQKYKKEKYKLWT
jgi:addiction module RelB/DinJ family antitoxin